ncbi:MAG TPA: tRNA (adenosine(37)-N6)-threonylcarbamoyltransferase complex ATPase subunit type 1 TsaE [Rhodanobacteraceae bacterium]|nr:tRNA (adenosine(37)-N6)-threonylcarbamoyltransferase complex ATPase subunit type 1 TsaE [Rhodanobacteraceae bacterium]
MSRASWNAGAVDEAGLRAIAERLASGAGEGGVIYLEGDLGAGKTTFARALLTSLGVGERVKSPTYSLIESYRAGALDAHHLDLYRIADAGELEWLGLADLWTPRALVLIEWPERGAGSLPPADLVMHFRHAGDRREVVAEPRTALGDRLAAGLIRPQNFTPSS